MTETDRRTRIHARQAEREREREQDNERDIDSKSVRKGAAYEQAKCCQKMRCDAMLSKVKGITLLASKCAGLHSIVVALLEMLLYLKYAYVLRYSKNTSLP